MGVDRAGIDFGRDAPNLLEKLDARQKLSRVLKKIDRQIELFLREIDRRMRFLTKRLELAEIVDPAAQQNRDQVFFGATVLYSDQTGLERRVTIVGVDEAEPLNGKISWISPVARALNKARVGDTITLRTPGGVEELDILEVSYADA